MHCRFVQSFDKDVNLFRLLENETLKIFSIWERRKRRHKFGGTKVGKAKEVRKYFVNPKNEIEVFSYIICSLEISHVLSFYCIWKRWMVSFRRTYWLSTTCFILLRVFRFFLFFSCFLSFFCDFYYLLMYWGKFSSGVAPRFLGGVSRSELLQLYLVINVTGLVEPTEPGSVWEKF